MNISAFKKIIAVSAVLALTAILIFPTISHTTISAKEHEPEAFEFTAPSGVFVVGEELVYNISYSVFDLGMLKIQILDTVSKGGVTAYRGKIFMDSYSGVPFVSLHMVFYSEMTNLPVSLFFMSHNTAKPDAMDYAKYSFDYPNKKVYYETGVEPKNIIYKKGDDELTEPQQDGLSLFFYARTHVHQVNKELVPTYLNEKSNITRFNFMNKKGSQEIDAIKYPVETIEFDGVMDFTGIFGLTGYFQGYFSNDDAAIPIVAKMKVIIGSARVELIKWNRPGWIPPKAKL